MAKFELNSTYQPAGDQPKAIAQIIHNLHSGYQHQTLLGVTGSGKTFTVANVIQNIQKPTLVIAHNKTLAAQLASEFRQFFPQNAVHYFVSYYDYYQPEAYVPQTDTYIEKDSSINDEIDRLRNAATQSLMTRRDVIIVASVSCIYGLGSPDIYRTSAIHLTRGLKLGFQNFLRRLADIMYERNDYELTRGKFRVKGDSIEVFPAYDERTVKFTFNGNEVEEIFALDPITGKSSKLDGFDLFPARHFLTDNTEVSDVLSQIESDMEKEVAVFTKEGRLIEAQRLKERTTFDLELIRETGICNGIENYSRYFDRRPPGSPPSVLLDYFPSDYLLVIDESHMTIPQIRGMYHGDRSRKDTLISYGFRLKAARDNRPLNFHEFSTRTNQIIYTSATPAEYEIEMSTKKNRIGNSEFPFPDSLPSLTPDGVVEQIVRPTGLLDPEVEVRPTINQVDDLINEIQKCVARQQRVLVTTLTKRMAEDLTEYLQEINIKVQYLHSDVETLERTDILRDLRAGKYDVLVGINLLREGLDLPEVSLVAILDADREGFLRNTTSFIQTFGRAARHLEGRVIMYADTITGSMKKALDETNRRREIQTKYNVEHHITPASIIKNIESATIVTTHESSLPEQSDVAYKDLPTEERRRLVKRYQSQMEEAVKRLDFEKAAELRDKIKTIKAVR